MGRRQQKRQKEEDFEEIKLGEMRRVEIVGKV
jgi:hypothetical protein